MDLLHDSTADTGEVTLRLVTIRPGDCAWSQVGDGVPVADMITLEAGDVVALSTAREWTVDHA